MRRSAFIGRSDKGLFVTTENFTRDAVREATRDGGTPIDRMARELFGTDRVKFFVNRDIEDSFVKENNGIEGLSLSGSGNILLDG